MLPMFLFPFDGYLVALVIGGVWLSRHYHWPRNRTVRRLNRLCRMDRGQQWNEPRIRPRPDRRTNSSTN
jgi:hypothetical protein